MALVLPGLGNPQGGSVGGLTYGRNRYGTYVRSRTTPTNPNSAKQNNARNSFRAAVSAWGTTLTSIQRGQWNNWAVNTPWLNKAGETVHLTGQAAFIRAMCAFQAAGMALTGVRLTPPVQNDVGTIDVTKAQTEISYNVTTGEFTEAAFTAPAITNSSGITNGNFLVEITPGLNAGVTFPGSRWSSYQVAGLSNFVWSAGVVDISAIPVLPWAYLLGQRVYFRFRAIGETDSDPERRVTTQTIVGPLTLVAPT